jgi:hypothetical protein
MELFSLLLFVLVSVGITNVVVNSKVLEFFREFITSNSSFLGEMLECMMCSGFWVGIIISCLSGFSVPIYMAFVSSLFSHLYGSVVGFIEVITALLWSQLNVEEN